ncbi:hypothetical protein BN1708_018379, partial [Verticillium longisporum]
KAVGDKAFVSTVGSIKTGTLAEQLISGGKDEDDTPLDLVATRDSSQTSFLRDAQGRSNLKVYTATLARRIVFDGAKRATGVVVSSAL